MWSNYVTHQHDLNVLHILLYLWGLLNIGKAKNCNEPHQQFNSHSLQAYVKFFDAWQCKFIIPRQIVCGQALCFCGEDVEEKISVKWVTKVLMDWFGTNLQHDFDRKVCSHILLKKSLSIIQLGRSDVDNQEVNNSSRHKMKKISFLYTFSYYASHNYRWMIFSHGNPWQQNFYWLHLGWVDFQPFI